MLIRINAMYFSWEPSRIDDVVAQLEAAEPFTAYPGFTRVESDGVNTQLSLDGRSTTMANTELRAALRVWQQELSQETGAFSSPSP